MKKFLSIFLVIFLLFMVSVLMVSCNVDEPEEISSKVEEPSSSSEVEEPSSSSEVEKSSSSSEVEKSSSSSKVDKPSSSSKVEKSSSSSEVEEPSQPKYPQKIGLEIEGEMGAVRESLTDPLLDEVIIINDLEFKNKVYGYLEEMTSQKLDEDKNPVSGGNSFRLHLYRSGVEEIYGVSPTPDGNGYHYVTNFQSSDDAIEHLLDENVFTMLMDLFEIN